MNKHNLIKLGALAQKTFDMDENFKIMEVASDDTNSINVVFSGSFSNMSVDRISVPTERETIELTKFGIQDNFEFIRAGYFRKENVLIIKEI
ncbi:MAG: hypothetical protein JRE23_16460 [Deltaproteobacteria bacterium]|nr:hypothetical protein [Deltaproteobacteria bacterium]